jgi:hypothetical protein
MGLTVIPDSATGCFDAALPSLGEFFYVQPSSMDATLEK